MREITPEMLYNKTLRVFTVIRVMIVNIIVIVVRTVLVESGSGS